MTTLAHPGSERRIKIIGMAGKPACQFVSQPAAGVMVPALSEQRLHLAHRVQYRCMFVDMAVARRKIGFLHPAIFFAEMRLEMRLDLSQPLSELIIGGITKRLDDLNEVFVQAIHGWKTKQ